MKKVERIFKNRLFGETDYSAVLSGGDLSGYKLERVDCEPIEVSTGEVCFSTLTARAAASRSQLNSLKENTVRL